MKIMIMIGVQVNLKSIWNGSSLKGLPDPVNVLEVDSCLMMNLVKVLMVSLLVSACSGDLIGHNHGQLARTGRQEENSVQGGFDFSGCVEDPV